MKYGGGKMVDNISVSITTTGTRSRSPSSEPVFQFVFRIDQIFVHTFKLAV